MPVAIIGNSGSGKSTLARRLAADRALPTLDLDTVAWEPNKIAVPRDHADAIADVKAFCETNKAWVIEGCYAGLVRAALQFSPTLLFLEPGVDACLSNCRNRPWEPHKYKSRREQDEKLEFLLSWVREYYVREGDLSLMAHQALFDDYLGPKRKLTTRVEQQLIDGSMFLET
jgi:adenylate kinase family enzyme